MRKIKELLQVMIDNQDCFESNGLYQAGLCSWVCNLYIYRKITSEEAGLLRDYIKNNRPSRYSSLSALIYMGSGFYWKPGVITYRIKWIKKHIKKNSI